VKIKHIFPLNLLCKIISVINVLCMCNIILYRHGDAADAGSIPWPRVAFFRTNHGVRRTSAVVPHGLTRSMAETYGWPIRNSVNHNTCTNLPNIKIYNSLPTPNGLCYRGLTNRKKNYIDIRLQTNGISHLFWNGWLVGLIKKSLFRILNKSAVKQRNNFCDFF